MILNARAAAILDAEYLSGDYASLHSAYSETGANELTGGTYAWQPITYAAASAATRSKATGAALVYAVPASSTVAFVSTWAPLGASAVTGATCSFATNVMTCTVAGTGSFAVWQVVSAAGVAAGTRIASLGTGAGGTGTYNLSTTPSTIAAEATTAYTPTLKSVHANGADAKSFQVDLTNNKILCEGLGVADGDRIAFFGTALPTGITAGALLYVVGTVLGDPDTCQVALTSGGAAIDLTTSSPSADAACTKVFVDAYASGGTHTVSSITQRI